MMYYTTTTPKGESIVIAKSDNVLVSFGLDEANTDYQAYQAWVAEGNTPEPWPPAE